MGYLIDIELEDVIVQDEEACLEAINKLHTEQNLALYAEGGSSKNLWYSFVHNPSGGRFLTLKEAFQQWRYDYDPQSHMLCQFTGEKLGQDEFLFQTIEPYVEDGGIAYFTGENGHQWCYYFINLKMS